VAIVYAICNTQSGAAYIGQSQYPLRFRWSGHHTLLQRGKHHNGLLQKAWDIDGLSSFVLVVLERFGVDGEGLTHLQRNHYERRWLARARAAGIVLYNDQVGRGRKEAA